MGCVGTYICRDWRREGGLQLRVNVNAMRTILWVVYEDFLSNRACERVDAVKNDKLQE